MIACEQVLARARPSARRNLYQLTTREHRNHQLVQLVLQCIELEIPIAWLLASNRRRAKAAAGAAASTGSHLLQVQIFKLTCKNNSFLLFRALEADMQQQTRLSQWTSRGPAACKSAVGRPVICSLLCCLEVRPFSCLQYLSNCPNIYSVFIILSLIYFCFFPMII